MAAFILVQLVKGKITQPYLASAEYFDHCISLSAHF